MALSKEERQRIAVAEAISETISKRKESKANAKEGVDLVGLTERMAKRRLSSEKE